jgi:xylulokinase
VGAGIYSSCGEAFVGLSKTKTIEPDAGEAEAYKDAYENWLSVLEVQVEAAY